MTKKAPNPTGKGGFIDNPQNRSKGYWKSEDSISFQYKRFLKMSITEIEEWSKNTPKDIRTTAMDIAYSQIIASRDSLKHTIEITDRTEGRAKQSVDVTSDGERIMPNILEVIDGVYGVRKADGGKSE